jgi:Transposase
VQVIGVDEHCWRHTRRGDKYVTVIIGLIPVREGTGPARLLDMVEGRSKQVFASWLHQHSAEFRNGIEVVAMDGFTGYKTAAAETVPDAVAVMDPFHVVALAGHALDRCRQRVQQETCGLRGHTGDPLYGIRRVLRTETDLLTDRQRARLHSVFADDRHVEVQTAWTVYQHIITAYRTPDRIAAKTQLHKAINAISTAVPKQLTELVTLGHTLTRRLGDVLAYFDRPGTSNGPTEAINGRLEHLRGSALGFRKPHQLHRQIVARDRRLQTTTTPSIRMSPLSARAARGLPDDQRGLRHAACGQFRVRMVEFGGEFGDPLPQRVDVRFQLDDPLDAGQVDAVLLRQPLHLAQQCDVAGGVAAPAAAGPARGHQAEPVVLPQRLRVHPGELRCHRDHEHRRVVGDVLRLSHDRPPVEGPP